MGQNVLNQRVIVTTTFFSYFSVIVILVDVCGIVVVEVDSLVALLLCSQPLVRSIFISPLKVASSVFIVRVIVIVSAFASLTVNTTSLEETVFPLVCVVLGMLHDSPTRTGFSPRLERIRVIESAANQCRDFSEMDFSFLFDKSRDLPSIGYNVGDHRMDSGIYDLLASEACLASYYAISKRQLGQEHWFALDRLLTASRDANVTELERVDVRVSRLSVRCLS